MKIGPFKTRRGQPGPSPFPAPRRVAALGIAAIGMLAFVKIAAEMLEGDTRRLDTAVLLSLRRPGDPADPVGPAWLERALVNVTALGGYEVLTLLVSATALYLLLRGQYASALLVLGAASVGALMSEALKLGFARPRPELVAHLVQVRSASFPSGHAMLSATVYLTLGALLAQAHCNPRLKALILGIAVAITALVGVTRVYLGEHWPTDVLAGWALGATWASLCWALAQLRDTGHPRQ